MQDTGDHMGNEIPKITLPSERHQQSLEYALRILTGERFRTYVKAIYLYGSCARGEQKYNSDVDLLIQVLDTTSPRLMRQMCAEATPEEAELPAVELKFSSGQEFSSSYQFNENIKREGKLIWEQA